MPSLVLVIPVSEWNRRWFENDSGVAWLNEGDPQGKAVSMSGYEVDLILELYAGLSAP